LSIALSWFNGTYNDQVGHFPEEQQTSEIANTNIQTPPSSSSSNQDKSLSWKPPKFLEEIESKIIRLSVSALLMTSFPASNSFSDNSKNTNNTVLIPHNEEVFEQLIGELINKDDNFIEAEKICQEFKFESKELVLCKTLHSLAMGTSSMQKLPPLVTTILNSKFPEYSTRVLHNDNDKADLLQRLCRCITHATRFCEKVTAKYTVARTLSISFDELEKKDPYEVLPFLLIEGPSKYELTKQFITCNRLDPKKVATILAQWYCNMVLEIDSKNIQRLSGQSNLRVCSNAVSSRNNSVHEYVDTEPKELKKTMSSIDLTEIETTDDNKQFSSCHSSYSSLPLVEISEGGPKPSYSLVTWSTHRFKDFISLTTYPDDVGRALVIYIMDNFNKISHHVEVELLIRAHFCFTLSHNVQGSTQVLQIIKDRVHEYVKHKEFRLLVRLVVGTKEYTNLQYILDILVEYDCFELILSTKKTFADDDNEKKELQRSLYFFLKLRHPRHTHLLKLLFLSFKMYREYADFCLEKAREEVKILSQKWKQNIITQEVNKLVEIMKTLLDAADYYAKGHCMQMYQVALAEAALVKLQLQNLDTKLLNIDEEDVRKLLMYMGTFSNCLVVAKAYKCDTLKYWIEPLYNQVIVLGNFEFLDDYLAYYPLTHELLVEMAVKFKGDTQKMNRQNHFKRFLEYYDDRFERYEMAKELGFTDMMATLASTPGIEYFKSRAEVDKKQG
jgi:uncharacterized protein YqeY